MKETDVASGVERGHQLLRKAKEKLSETRPVGGKEIPNWTIILLGILGLLVISLIVWGIVSYLSPAPPGPAPSGPAPPASAEAAETPPTPADCVGGWSTCDASCSKTYNVTSEAVGTGAACPVATGFTADCDPGEGACPSSALALIEEVIDNTFDPSLCNSNTAVSNITEMPCSNDFNRFLIYWTKQIEHCNSDTNPPCNGLTYSDVYDDYLTSGTPGSCSEDSILHGIIQNSLEMCHSVEQDDSCLISDMSPNGKRACCRIQEEWDGTTTAYSAEIVDGCVNLSPSCTRDNINSQANRDTCHRWNVEQRRQNPPPTTPDELQGMVELSDECTQILNNNCAGAKRASVGNCQICGRSYSPSPCTKENINYFCQGDGDSEIVSGGSGATHAGTPDVCPFDPTNPNALNEYFINHIKVDCQIGGEDGSILKPCSPTCTNTLNAIAPCGSLGYNNPTYDQIMNFAQDCNEGF